MQNSEETREFRSGSLQIAKNIGKWLFIFIIAIVTIMSFIEYLSAEPTAGHDAIPLNLAIPK